MALTWISGCDHRSSLKVAGSEPVATIYIERVHSPRSMRISGIRQEARPVGLNGRASHPSAPTGEVYRLLQHIFRHPLIQPKFSQKLNTNFIPRIPQKTVSSWILTCFAMHQLRWSRPDPPVLLLLIFSG